MARESFRAGAGAVILDADGRVLAFERSDVQPSAWQLPQGGLDAGEEPETAVYREVLEETGLRPEQLEEIARLVEPLAYELPESMRTGKTGRGQVHYWFFFRLKGGASPRLSEGGEFQSWKPMHFHELVQEVVAFRRTVYQRLARDLARILDSS